LAQARPRVLRHCNSRATMRAMLETMKEKVPLFGRQAENAVVNSPRGTRGLATAAAPAKTGNLEAWCEVGPNGKPCHGGEETSKCTGLITIKELPMEECRTAFPDGLGASMAGGGFGRDPFDDCVKIEWFVKGLVRPGLHGFHIHETSDFSKGCVSAGPHYNPFNRLHGGPDDAERHVGSLGNIDGDNTGVAKGFMIDREVKIKGPYTVIGRSFMVHEDPDDLGRGDNSAFPEPINGKCSLLTGNAGARIACGEIKQGPPPKTMLEKY